MNPVIRHGGVAAPLLLVLAAVAAALPVKVTTLLFPPYSPHLSDYTTQPNKLLVTVQSQPGSPVYKVRLAARVIGVDNPILIATEPGYKPPQPLVLQPAVPVNVTVADLKQYFALDHLVFTNITKQQLAQGDGLPEGTYRICVRAYDYETGDPLSDPEPVGCSGPFVIKSVEPPVILTPLAGSTVAPLTPQALSFSWTMSAGAPPLVEYTLKLVELVPKTRDPYDAMNSATQPPFYEGKTVVTSLLIGPTQPILKKGSRYAARVTIRDPQGKTYFKNKGQSQVITFDYGTSPGYLPQLPPLPPGPGGSKPGKLFLTSRVFGQLMYDFPGFRSGRGGSAKARPLANVPVRLVLYYFIYKTGTKEQLYYQSDPIPGFTNAGKTLAAGTTDANGNFDLSFLAKESLGLLGKDSSITIGTAPEFKKHFKGDLWRVARLIVEEPHFVSPDDDIVVQPLEMKDVGALYADARLYGMTVTTMPSAYKKEAQYTQGALSGIIVYVLRKNRPEHVPENEGTPPVPAMVKGGMQVIGMDTTDNNGRATFRGLVKNIGPNDKYYIHAEPDPRGDKNYISIKTSFAYDFVDRSGETLAIPMDHAVFNRDFKVGRAATEKSMHPLLPEITGFVYRDDNPNLPVGGAKVELRNYAVFGWLLEQATLTDSAGRFAFQALGLSYDESGVVKGPVRGLKVTAAGFRDTSLAVPPGGIPLKLGQRVHYPKLRLFPDAFVKGRVTDESGEGANAKVTIGNGTALTATSKVMLIPGFKWAPAGFSGHAPSGKDQRVVIDPENKAFFAETAFVAIGKGVQDLGTFKVYRREHRIRVKVTNWPVLGVKSPLAGAHVTVAGVGSMLSNDAGIAEFRFKSSTDSFAITVASPDGADYVARTKNVKAPLSKTWVEVPFPLAAGVHVAGHVYAGKTPVEGARVYLADAGSPSVQAFTDAAGAYLIRGVPKLSSARLRAVKSKSNYVGDSAVVSTNAHVDGLDFHLTVYEDMDITGLLGFPIEVTDIKPTSDGAQLSGTFINLPANSQFGPQDSLATIGFGDVAIVPGTEKNAQGVPRTRPKSLPVKTTANQLGLKVYEKLVGQLEDKTTGLVVDEVAGSGAVKGGVVVTAASFTDPNLSFDEDGFALTDPAGGKLLPAVNAAGSVPFPDPAGLPARSKGVGPIDYKLYGFTCEAETAGSRLAASGLSLNTTLHTHLQHITPSDIKLKLGIVRVENGMVQPLVGESPLTFPLEKWQIVADSWSLTTAGLVLNKGKVKTTSVDVPFTGMQVKDSTLAYGSYDLKNLSIASVIPLTVLGKTSFGWDPGKKHWSLSVTPDTGTTAAYFSGMPGMGSGDKVRIDNFYLLSSGEDGFTPMPKPITLYKVATFTPSMLTAYADYVHIPGVIDVHVPLAKAQSAAIDYSKPGGALKFGLQSFTLGFAAKGVQLDFLGDPAHPQTLDERGFIARGRVYEPDKWGLEVTLFRTVESTAIWVVPKESLDVDAAGKRKLRNVVGHMRVASGAWENFTFSGDLVGADGATSYLTFVVKGEVLADDQSVSVKNLPTPFGGLALTYDFEHHRLIGQLHFKQVMEGGAWAEGDAEAVVDGDGWYFLSGGSFYLPQQSVEGQAALLFGSYPMTAAIKSTFAKYSFVYDEYGSLPVTFPTEVKGFYFEGEGAVPVPVIPQGEFNFGLVAGVLKVQAGGDVRFGMQFSKGTTFSVGQSVFIIAKAGLGAGFVGVCAGLSAQVKVVTSWDGQYSTSGAWFVDGDGHVTLSGSTYLGGGLCDADCGGKFCVKASLDDSKTLGFKGHYGTDYKKFEFYWE